MLVDVILAIAHFLLIFAILSALVYEMAVIRPGLTPGALRRVSLADMIYGVAAGLLVAVGFGRVYFGLKGADFYLGSTTFWIKIALFVLVGLISIQPTLRIIRWRRSAVADAAFSPAAAEIAVVRRSIHLELTVFAIIPVFAVLMARGIG